MVYILALAISLVGQTALANSEYVVKASCRITATDGRAQNRGSGIVIKETQGSYYVLTCGHVLDGCNSFAVEFFRDGFISAKVPASLVSTRYVTDTTVDAAILMVSKDRMLGYKPNVISLAPSTYQSKPQTPIFGAGCPQGKWVQYWESRINKNYGNAVGFNMSPVSGQSGSGILTVIGNKPYVIGIVTWSTEDGPNGGGGVSVSRIYECIYGNPARDTIPIKHRIVADKAIDTTELDETCKRCGLPRSQHYAKIEQDGTTGHYCLKCKTHGLYYNQHLHQGMQESQFCGPGGCFPRRPSTPERPQTPTPQVPLPNDLFPDAIPEQNTGGGMSPIEDEIARLQAELDAAKKAAEHPLDATTGGHGTAVQNTSFTLAGGLAGAFLWNTLGVPFLIRRTGALPGRIIAALGGRGLKKLLKKKLGVDLDAERAESPQQTVPPTDRLSQIRQELIDVIEKKIEPILPKDENLRLLLEKLKLDILNVVDGKFAGIIAVIDDRLRKYLSADLIEFLKNKVNPSLQPAQAEVSSEYVGPIPTPVSVDGLSRNREFFQTPFVKKEPTAEMIMNVLGNIQNEYGDTNKISPKQVNEMLRQRLKILYGIE